MNQHFRQFKVAHDISGSFSDARHLDAESFVGKPGVITAECEIPDSMTPLLPNVARIRAKVLFPIVCQGLRHDVLYGRLFGIRRLSVAERGFKLLKNGKGILALVEVESSKGALEPRVARERTPLC